MIQIENLVTFCRELRAHGVPVTSAEEIAAATALQLIDTGDRNEVFLSLRSVLTTSVDDFPIFAELFETFWTNTSRPRRAVVSPKQSTGGIAFFLENWNNSLRTDGEAVDLPCANDAE